MFAVPNNGEDTPPETGGPKAFRAATAERAPAADLPGQLAADICEATTERAPASATPAADLPGQLASDIFEAATERASERASAAAAPLIRMNPLPSVAGRLAGTPPRTRG